MNLKQQTFVTEYLRHRSAYTAYCIAYNTESSNYESVMSAANRLLHHPEVAATISSILGTIRKEVEEEVRKELKAELLTVQRKRELLAQIATGEMYVPQNYKGKDCSQCTQMVTPTINQMLKAIDLDSKLAGHYSAQQITPVVTPTVIAGPDPQPHVQQSQQTTTKEPETPLLDSGGEHYKERVAVCNAGEVTSRRSRNSNESQHPIAIAGPDPQPHVQQSQQIATKEPETSLLDSGGEHYKERVAVCNGGGGHLATVTQQLTTPHRHCGPSPATSRPAITTNHNKRARNSPPGLRRGALQRADSCL